MKGGKEYLAFDDKFLSLQLGKPIFQFDNLFRDNKELNDRTNQLFNENVIDLIEELRPIIDKIVTQFVFGIVERIFNKFSMDELFLP